MICVLMLLEHVLGKTIEAHGRKGRTVLTLRTRGNDGSGSCGNTKILIPFTQFVTLEDCLSKHRLFFRKRADGDKK